MQKRVSTYTYIYIYRVAALSISANNSSRRFIMPRRDADGTVAAVVGVVGIFRGNKSNLASADYQRPIINIDNDGCAERRKRRMIAIANYMVGLVTL